MPPDLIKVFISLYDKYHPIEISTEISEEAKVPYMVEWYQAARRNMMMSGIRKDVIKKSVEISKLRLRYDMRFSRISSDILAELSVEFNYLFYIYFYVGITQKTCSKCFTRPRFQS